MTDMKKAASMKTYIIGTWYDGNLMNRVEIKAASVDNLRKRLVKMSKDRDHIFMGIIDGDRTHSFEKGYGGECLWYANMQGHKWQSVSLIDPKTGKLGRKL